MKMVLRSVLVTLIFGAIILLVSVASASALGRRDEVAVAAREKVALVALERARNQLAYMDVLVSFFDVQGFVQELVTSLETDSTYKCVINDSIDNQVVEVVASGSDRVLVPTRTLLDLAYLQQKMYSHERQQQIALVIACLKRHGAKTAYRLSWDETFCHMCCCSRDKRKTS